MVIKKYKIVDDIDTEEILRNYIKYLDLYIIDDWKFENNILVSEKARLIACLTYDDDGVGILGIYSKDSEYIKNKYNLRN